MRKQNIFKKAAAAALAAAMVMGTAFTAMAAPTIDPAATGSLQIRKLKTGTTESGIADVQFYYAQVGTFEQTAGAVSGFNITNDELEGYLTDAGLTPIDGTQDVYDGADVQDALVDAMADADVKEAVKALATTAFDKTDSNGYTNKVENLALGLYLVAETDAPVAVTKLADPFIVSVPILEEVDGTQSWNYDVVAQPKNDYIDQVPDPDKTVVGGNGTEDLDDSVNIGDTVTFEISSTVPEVSGTLEKFVFTDKLSEGLTYTAGQTITVEGIKAGNDTYEAVGTDLYTTAFDDAARTLTVTFLNPDTNIKNVYTNIRARYTAELNENAVIGGEGNKNDFTVSYTNDPALDVSTDEVVDTYAFTLKKTNKDAEALAGATFKLYDEATGGQEVSFYTAVGQDGKVTGNKTAEVTTDSNGEASFYGLKAGTYYLEETKAPEGYNLLKERVEVVVGEDSTTPEVDITVVNTQGFSLPTTGGMGTVLFTLIGIILMAGAACVAVVYSRKKKMN